MTAATTNAHVAAQQILPLEHLDLLIGKHPLDFRRPLLTHHRNNRSSCLALSAGRLIDRSNPITHLR